jgi:hypothetical protein
MIHVTIKIGHVKPLVGILADIARRGSSVDLAAREGAILFNSMSDDHVFFASVKLHGAAVQEEIHAEGGFLRVNAQDLVKILKRARARDEVALREDREQNRLHVTLRRDDGRLARAFSVGLAPQHNAFTGEESEFLELDTLLASIAEQYAEETGRDAEQSVGVLWTLDAALLAELLKDAELVGKNVTLVAQPSAGVLRVAPDYGNASELETVVDAELFEEFTVGPTLAEEARAPGGAPVGKYNAEVLGQFVAACKPLDAVTLAARAPYLKEEDSVIHMQPLEASAALVDDFGERLMEYMFFAAPLVEDPYNALADDADALNDAGFDFADEDDLALVDDVDADDDEFTDF